MKKILILLIALSFVSNSRLIFSQTHYSGKVNLFHTLNDCTGKHIDTAFTAIDYSLYPRTGLSDSVAFTIHISLLYNSGIFTKQHQFPVDAFAGSAFNTNIKYLKDDADSLVFLFTIQYSFTEHNAFVELTDPCRNHNDDEYFTGTARISKLTAGIPIKANTNSIKVFPNPTTGLIHLKTNSSKAIITDNLGRIVTTFILLESDAAGFVTLDVSNLLAGYYSLLLDNGTKKAVGKFIKY